MEYVKKHYDITAADICSGKYDPQQLIDPLWWSVSIYDGYEQYERDLTPFTKAQRAVFAIMWYEAEVCNGGHDQFFSNSTGIVWQDALAGFAMIGAAACENNLRAVIEKWGGSVPFDRAQREEMLEKLTYLPEEDDWIDLFAENDSVFYDHEDGLAALIMDYAKDHAEQFVFCGEVEVPADMA